MSFVERRSEETRRYLFYFFVALGAIVALITVVIAQLSWRGWVQGLRALLRGEGLLRPASAADVPELRPIARDVRELMRELEAQYRPRDESQLAWTPETLRAILQGRAARQRRDRRQQPRAVHPRRRRPTASACSVRRAASSPRSSR